MADDLAGKNPGAVSLVDKNSLSFKMLHQSSVCVYIYK